MAANESEGLLRKDAPPSKWQGLTGKIALLTGFLVGVAALIDAVAAVATRTQTLTCRLPFSLPWCPDDASRVSTSSDVSIGSTGWIYVGTRIGGQWKKSGADGIEPSLTIETDGLPTHGVVYPVIVGVHLRGNLPQVESGRPLMSDSKGAIAVGSRVKVDDIREITVANPTRIWVWAHVTLVR